MADATLLGTDAPAEADGVAVAEPPSPATEAGTPAAPPAESAAPAAPSASPASPEAAKPVEIDYRTVQLPADSPLDAAALERSVALARAHGLSPEVAQALVETLHTEVASTRDALLAAHAPGGAAWTTQQQTWKQAALADPEIGGAPEKLDVSVAQAKRAFQRFGAPGLLEALETTGLGSHPEVVRVFARIGAAMREGDILPAQPPSGQAERSLTDIFYGKQE